MAFGRNDAQDPGATWEPGAANDRLAATAGARPGAVFTSDLSVSEFVLLNEAGFEVMSDCERGECGVCAIDVVAVDGEIDHRDVFFSDHQKQGNAKICPCVSRAVGTVTVDTLYRPDAA